MALNEPRLPLAPPLPRAVSLLMRLTAAEMEGVERGPTPRYYAGYRRLNAALAEASHALAEALLGAGFACEVVAPTGTTTGDRLASGTFAHKTAATQAGLGWIGKTALLVSPAFGPRVRLATVFTDMPLATGRAHGGRKMRKVPRLRRCMPRRAPAGTFGGRQGCREMNCSMLAPAWSRTRG